MTGKNIDIITVNIATDTAWFGNMFARAYQLVGKELPAAEVFEHLFEGRRALDSATFKQEASQRILETAFPPPLSAPPPDEPLHKHIGKKALFEAINRLSLSAYDTSTLGNRLLTPVSDFVAEILPLLLSLAGFLYLAPYLDDDWLLLVLGFMVALIVGSVLLKILLTALAEAFQKIRPDADSAELVRHVLDAGVANALRAVPEGYDEAVFLVFMRYYFGAKLYPCVEYRFRIIHEPPPVDYTQYDTGIYTI